ncbi:hypothetical protein KC19_12G110400 [Ceratodon purpureus]|uniref:Uncharacterized protein n=1 Tax=Ceratodon purpureus TaxID=3225 RepID=A0A8T0GBP9_CERPU|nr:hypothetical protein KC19_12G110400 [Ceratodon purpureus]
MGVVVTSFSVEHGHHIAPSSSFVGESPSARIPFPFTLRALPSFTLTDINPCLDSRLPIDRDCSLQSIVIARVDMPAEGHRSCSVLPANF